MSIRAVEDVFITEGIPQETFIEPPNFHEIFVDIRKPKKPIIVEGQSGTGKTTTVKKALQRLSGEIQYNYLSARRGEDLTKINNLANHPTTGIFIIDDFHRLGAEIQQKLADIAKLAAEEGEGTNLPKLVIIGINQVGMSLIHLVPDIAKRLGIHKILPADESRVARLVESGCKLLNINFDNPEQIFQESGGDYWLTQRICQTACLLNEVTETQQSTRNIVFQKGQIRQHLVGQLQHTYKPAVREFCRGNKFRPSNDPYYKLLKVVSESGSAAVELTSLAAANPEVSQSINNIKDKRLSVLFHNKEGLDRYFYYNSETAQFVIEDPALYYYIKHLDWTALRFDCGFKAPIGKQYKYEIALSFAGENRELASIISKQLELLDVSVFLDEHHEVNWLGKAIHIELKKIFEDESRFVVCLLDRNHLEKIWPTFEREIFLPRIQQQEVIPIYLDDTHFPGIPNDLYGIIFKYNPSDPTWREKIDNEIIFKLIDKIG